eukprot:TRINITY_DN1766_c0_g1_i1.p1 TRINITY_DN1766_c0_g1~~TRINITY_DN1766_c0_g1_i1.p1  ORF type:complete len:133 (-),score=8.90 TRINITY_DN1766_c0_g1_i1:69-467(-)
MGKRKSRKAPAPARKKTAPIPTSFDCPFCNHEHSVECRMDRERDIGNIRCTVCDAAYQMIINHLSEPVDVYSEWLDECQVQNEAATTSTERGLNSGAKESRLNSNTTGHVTSNRNRRGEDEDDDNVPEPEDD